MKRIKAFTIIELIVTMMIGSIVIGFCYFALTGLNTSLQKITIRTNEIGEYRLFEKTMRLDAMNAVAIQKSEDAVLFCFSDSSIAQYRMEDTSVIRSKEGNETRFNISSELTDFHLCPENNAVIDQLVINVTILGERIPLNLLKTYTPVELLHTEIIVHE